jgi:ectoine hydroxylase-related dioxygenase (phytanoyl-CoA dioxygenase family)
MVDLTQNGHDNQPEGTYLTEASLRAYADAGYVFLSGIFSPGEMRTLRAQMLEAASETAVGQHGERFLRLSQEDAGHGAILSRLSERLGALAATLLGVDAVRLLNGNVYIDPPGTPVGQWHQELWYIPLNSDRLLTFCVLLAPVAEDDAYLLVVPGSHRGGYQELAPEVDPSERFPIVNAKHLRAGDVCAYSGWTLHGAPENTSTGTREAVCLCYFADGAEMFSGAELRANPRRWHHISAYLESPGYKDVGSDAFPLVYQRAR